jgi:[pyruvate, water dikinase]-phosphate phosphotransferase / [pyruvate, water dikinase] kinase
MADETPHAIFLVSDGTCRTCEQVVKSVLVQFQDARFSLVLKPKILDVAAVREVIDEAAAQRAVVFYTLVAKETRDAIKTAAQQRMVPVVDVLGPVLIALFDVFQRLPLATPDMLYKSDKEHYDRVDAVEYTLNHDDGCRPQDLSEADVVLVGVSRAAKSTTCFYLAYSGIRAANVPLFADSDPPAELTKLDPRKVIGLTVNPHRLQSMREARLRGWGMDVSHNYADSIEIARELRAASEQMARFGWRCIDVSYKAIEEVAREIRQMLTEPASTPDKR